MNYKRLPIEIEAPEGLGYEKIECNLSESSFTDQRLNDLGIFIHDIPLIYGNHLGKAELREWIAADSGTGPSDVLITAGAAMALFMVSTSFLEKGDRMVVAKSNYATNIETPRALGANVSYLNMRFDNGYKIDLDELDRLTGPDTKLVSLTYPHNPTGVMIDESVLKKIIAMLERKNILLLFDETYRDMHFAPKLPVAASLSDKVISVSSMSKSYGLPGIRIGWLICQDKQRMETLLAAKEQIMITNSVLDEEIAFGYLRNKEKLFTPVKETIRKNFDIMKAFMLNHELLEWVEPQGGCVCCPRIKKHIKLDVQQFHKLLLSKYSTYVGRGHWFEEDDRYMRIGYSWDKTDKLIKGLSNINQAISELKE
jgi:aspartate/methionine/tyrosine aminotransferase